MRAPVACIIVIALVGLSSVVSAQRGPDPKDDAHRGKKATADQKYCQCSKSFKTGAQGPIIVGIPSNFFVDTRNLCNGNTETPKTAVVDWGDGHREAFRSGTPLTLHHIYGPISSEEAPYDIRVSASSDCWYKGNGECRYSCTVNTLDAVRVFKPGKVNK
jgi:hypothetical protein